MNRERITQIMEYSTVLACKQTVAVIFVCEGEEVAFVSCLKKDLESGIPIQVTVYEEVYDSCGIYASDEVPDYECLMQHVALCFKRRCHGKVCNYVAVINHIRHDKALVYQFPKDIRRVSKMTVQKKGGNIVFLLPTKISREQKHKLQYYHALVWSCLLVDRGDIIN